MITFFLLTCLLVFSFKNNKETLIFLGSYYFLAILCLVFKLIEFESGNIEFFISDENTYARAAEVAIGDLERPTRFLWFLLNHLLINYDLFGRLALKLINIPIGALLILKLFKEFEIKKYSNVALLLLPYIFVLSTFNFRDLLILLLSSYLIFELNSARVQTLVRIFFFALLLYFLRPEMVVVIFGAFIFMYWLKKFSFRIRLREVKRIVFVAIFFTIIVWIFWESIDAYIWKRITYIEYTFGSNYDEHANRRNIETSGNLFQDMAMGVIRYVFAPIPTSISGRLLSGTNRYGYTDDVFLLINQLSYFSIVAYISLYLPTLLRILKQLRFQQKVLLLFFFSHSIIYGAFLLGGTHQRLKFPFQMGLLILFFLVWDFRLKNRKRGYGISHK